MKSVMRDIVVDRRELWGPAINLLLFNLWFYCFVFTCIRRTDGRLGTDLVTVLCDRDGVYYTQAEQAQNSDDFPHSDRTHL